MEKFVWLVIISLFSLGFPTNGGEEMRKNGAEISPPPPPATHELEIKKINNKWKVVLKGDDSETTIRAKRGDVIKWTAVGTDAYFQFMDTDLVGRYTDFIAAGKTKPLTIGNRAKDSVNVYAVFCLQGKEYAEGDSPPMIIID